MKDWKICDIDPAFMRHSWGEYWSKLSSGGTPRWIIKCVEYVCGGMNVVKVYKYGIEYTGRLPKYVHCQLNEMIYS